MGCPHRLHRSPRNIQFFGRYSQSGRKDVRPAPLPGLANGGNSSTGVGHEDTNGASVGYTRTFSPRVVNELRVGFNYVHVRRGVPEAATRFRRRNYKCRVYRTIRGSTDSLYLSRAGYRRVGDPWFAPTILASQERQITDVLTWVHGAHTIKLGGGNSVEPVQHFTGGCTSRALRFQRPIHAEPGRPK